MVWVLAVAFLLLYLRKYSNEQSAAKAFADTCVVMAALTVFACEFFSIFSMYTTIVLSIYWILVSAALAVWNKAAIIKGFQKLFSHRKIGKALDWRCVLLLGTIAIFVGGSFLLALLYPPTTNYDSLVYHMPRTFFWMKNASVHHYPTPVARELMTAPFTEFAILQIRVLCNGWDIFSNLVQWCAFVGSIVMVPAISRLLGIGLKGQLLGGLLTATIPLAVMQACSTQTDLFSAFWTVVAVYYVVWYIKNKPSGKEELIWALYIGGACGIAILTKASSAASLLCFAGLLLLFTLKRVGVFRILQLGGIVAACTLLLVMGHFIRNGIDFNGDLLGTKNQELSYGMLTSKSIKKHTASVITNISYNLASRNYYWQYNLEKAVLGVLDALSIEYGKNGAPVDPETFNIPQPLFLNATTTPYHDIAGSPYHMALILIMGVVIVATTPFSKKPDWLVFAYVLTCLLSIWVTLWPIKIVTSSTRYLMPAIMLGTAYVPVAIKKMAPRGSLRYAAASMGLVYIVIYSLPYLLFNVSQPLVDNPTLAVQLKVTNVEMGWYNTSRGDLRTSGMYFEDLKAPTRFQQRIESENATQIGLQWHSFAYYPLLCLWTDTKYTVQHIAPAWHSAQASDSFIPDAIVTNLPVGVEPAGYETIYKDKTYYCADSEYCPMFNFHYALLLPKEKGPN